LTEVLEDAFDVAVFADILESRLGTNALEWLEIVAATENAKVDKLSEKG
jgi:hypothetical protein